MYTETDDCQSILLIFIFFTRCTIRLSIQIHGYLKVAAYRGHVLLAFHIQSMLNRGSHYYFGSPMIYLI